MYEIALIVYVGSSCQVSEINWESRKSLHMAWVDLLSLPLTPLTDLPCVNGSPVLCVAAFFLVDLIEKASPVHTHSNNNYRFIAIMQVNLH